MTSSPIEPLPHTSAITLPRPGLTWRPTLVDLRGSAPRLKARLRWRTLPAALQFLLASFLLAAVILGGTVAFLTIFDAWYGPHLAATIHGLGLEL